MWMKQRRGASLREAVRAARVRKARRRDQTAHGRSRLRSHHLPGPSQYVLAHRLRRLVLLCAAMRARACRGRDADLVRPRPGCQERRIHHRSARPQYRSVLGGLVQHAVGHPYDELAELIRARGWGKARIGVEMDAHYYTARCHAHLVKGLPDAKIRQQWRSRELGAARQVATPSSSYMREAGRICTHAMNARHRQDEAGRAATPRHRRDLSRPDHGRCRRRRRLCRDLPADAGGRRHQHAASDLDRRSRCPTTRLAMLEIAGARRRYHAPLTRTIYLGKPPQTISDVAKAVVEGVDAGLAMAKPGNTRRAGRGGLAGGAAPQWSQEGKPRRLFDRPFLSARLGRAHRELCGRATRPSCRPACASTSSPGVWLEGFRRRDLGILRRHRRRAANASAMWRAN